MANIEELQRTMTEILDHPEHWDQSAWVCGTTGCFAGLTAMRHGWRDINRHRFEELPPRAGWMFHRGFAQPQHAPTIARCILQLTNDEAERLFFHATTVEMLEQMIKDLANGEDLYDLWPRSMQIVYNNATGEGTVVTRYIRRKETHDHS